MQLQPTDSKASINQARPNAISAPDAAPRLHLPHAPLELVGPVKAWSEDTEILTYLPDEPDRNPMFLEKRVYQGSSGRVYPLPFIDRIATEPQMKMWKAIHLENEYLRVMILPEIGGRIHVGYDKVAGFDFFYRQNVIKPGFPVELSSIGRSTIALQPLCRSKPTLKEGPMDPLRYGAVTMTRWSE